MAGWLALNVALIFHPLTPVLLQPPQPGIWHDYLIWAQIPERLQEGTLYQPGPGYHYVFAPAMAYVLAVVIPLGYPLWWALHLAVLPLLRDWRLIALLLLSVGFWVDTMIGSTSVFVIVAGLLALRGSSVGAVAYVALFLLMPRPVHLPLAAWLAWQRPDLRGWFLGLAGVFAVTTLASGYTVEWVSELFAFGQSNHANDGNFSPTRWFGLAWYVVGIPLTVWLTLKGKVGLAGLALTPYFGPPYLLNLLWDLSPDRVRSDREVAPGVGVR